MRKYLVTAGIAAVAAVLLTAPAFAGKGGSRGAATDPPYSVTVTPGGPYLFGEAIYTTTDVPVAAGSTGPWIGLACYQNGVFVEGGSHAGFPGGMEFNYPWVLGQTGLWTAGAGDCTVTVFHVNNNKVVTDATTSFHVDG